MANGFIQTALETIVSAHSVFSQRQVEAVSNFNANRLQNTFVDNLITEKRYFMDQSDAKQVQLKNLENVVVDTYPLTFSFLAISEATKRTVTVLSIKSLIEHCCELQE